MNTDTDKSAQPTGVNPGSPAEASVPGLAMHDSATIIKMVPHSKIIPGPNPRTSFDETRHEELRASMRSRGFDPAFSLLVRAIVYRIDEQPHWNTLLNAKMWVVQRWSKNWVDISHHNTREEAEGHIQNLPTFEIACGERRWRASGAEQIEMLPVIERDMTDQEMLEIGMMENLQRDGLNVMDEARGYKRLLQFKDESGNPTHTVETIALKLGQSEKHVRDCLALCRLEGTPAGEAIESGRLPRTHGRVLARVPSAAMRAKLVKEVLHPRYGDGGCMPRAELEKRIKLDYMVELRNCSFDPDDETLVEIVTDANGERIMGGACHDCPLNSKNQGGEDHSRANVCMNTECFRAKTAASYNRWAESVSDPEKKITALPVEENNKLFAEWNGISLPHGSKYTDLHSKPEEGMLQPGAKAKPWKQLIKGQDVPVIIAKDGTGAVRELAETALVLTASLENDKSRPEKERVFKHKEMEQHESLESDEDREERLLKEQRAREKAARINDAMINAVIKGAELPELPDGCLLRELHLLLCEMDNQMIDFEEVIARHWGKSTLVGDNPYQFIKKHVANLSIAKMHSLRLDLLFHFYQGTVSLMEDLPGWAKLLGVDLKAVKKEVTAQIAEEEKTAQREASFDYVKEMKAARTADEGRVVISTHEEHIQGLQSGMGLKPTCGEVEPGHTRGFSVVSDAQWNAAFKEAEALDMRKAGLLRKLVQQGKDFAPIWQNLYEAERVHENEAYSDVEKQQVKDSFASLTTMRKMSLAEIEDLCLLVTNRPYESCTAADLQKCIDHLMAQPHEGEEAEKPKKQGPKKPVKKSEPPVKKRPAKAKPAKAKKAGKKGGAK